MTRISQLLSGAAIVALASAAPALAAGTEADTPIVNSITVSYDAGGDTVTEPDAASDAFLVDEKIDFSLQALDSPTTVTVTPGATNQVLTFLLTNEGNAERPFDIDISQVGGASPLGLLFDASGSGATGTWSVYLSQNATGGPDFLYDPTGISEFPLPADGPVYVKIVANIPASATNGEEDSFTVTARALNSAGTAVATESSAFDPATTDLVFGDPGQDNAEDAAEAYLVASATVSATKTVSVVSENRDGTFNCATDPAEAGAAAFIPGACIAYTITVSNAPGAGADADSVTFTDDLPANVTFVNVFENNGFSVSFGAGTVTGSVPTLTPGDSADLTIRMLLD